MLSQLLHSVETMSEYCLLCDTCSLRRRHSEGINTDYTGNRVHILGPDLQRTLRFILRLS